MENLSLAEAQEDYIKLRKSNNVTHFELAQAEHLLWQHFCRVFGDNHNTSQRQWLVKNIGLDTVATYENRATLYHQRSWSLPLFDKVESKAMTLATATRLTRTVKAYSKEHTLAKSEALAKFLEGFDGTAESLRAVEMNKPISQLDRTISKASQAFKQQVLALSASFIEQILQDMPDAAYHKRTLTESFSVSQEQLIEELRFSIKKIKTQTRNTAADETIDSTSFEWACEVLGVIDFEFGKDIDIIRASRSKFRRARELHPDRNPAPEAVEEYQAVIEAFKILEHYHTKRKRNILK
jgi:hypothetical protein